MLTKEIIATLLRAGRPDLANVVAAVAPPKQVLRQRTGVKGPNGAVLVGYEWKSTLAEEYSKHEDGLVGKRVSDWENAVPCETCGRKIVHIFWVRGVDGKIKSYGGDHLHIPLGYDRELPKSKVKRLRHKVLNVEDERKREQEKAKSYEMAIKKFAVPFAFGQGIIGECNDRYRAASRRATQPPVFLVSPRRKMAMRADDFYQGFLGIKKDWRQMKPVDIRALVG